MRRVRDSAIKKRNGQEGVRLDQLAVLVKSLGDSQGLWCK